MIETGAVEGLHGDTIIPLRNKASCVEAFLSELDGLENVELTD